MTRPKARPEGRDKFTAYRQQLDLDTTDLIKYDQPSDRDGQDEKETDENENQYNEREN